MMGKVVIRGVLPTKTKMFCNCLMNRDLFMDWEEENNSVEENNFAEENNSVEEKRETLVSCACPVCLKLPGAFPVLNKQAVELAAALVLAFGGTVTQYTLFDRVKNEEGIYSRISQYSYPIGKDGFVELKGDVTKSLQQEQADLDGTERKEQKETTEPLRIPIPVMRLEESEEEAGLPMLTLESDTFDEAWNPYYIEETEKILASLGLEEWEIIETDDVIETMESQTPISYLPDPDLPPVIISQWWIDQITAKYLSRKNA